MTGACGTQPTLTRYLYVLSCDARLDKLDTIENRKLESYELAKLPANPSVPAAGAGFDGCLAYQAEYDPSGPAFYTIVPVQSMVKPNGLKDYRELELSIPDVRIVKSIPAGSDLNAPPHLSFLGGQAKLTPSADWRPQTEVDLSALAPDEHALGNQIIEQSGSRVLLRLFAANPSQLSLAVADIRAKRLIRLSETPATTLANAHLAPGGGAILIEEVSGSPKPVKTGRLFVYDATTGRLLDQLTTAAARDRYFLAISPSGRAIYHSADAYSFVDLKRQFSADEVTRPNPSSYAAMFFAGK